MGNPFERILQYSAVTILSDHAGLKLDLLFQAPTTVHNLPDTMILMRTMTACAKSFPSQRNFLENISRDDI